MTKRIAIWLWAYTIGPYADHPIPFDVVCDKVKALGFDGLEFGSVPAPSQPRQSRRPGCRLAGRHGRRSRSAWSLLRRCANAISGSAVLLPISWAKAASNTDDQSKYIFEFQRNSNFARDPRHSDRPAVDLRAAADHPSRKWTTRLRSDRVVGTWRTCWRHRGANGPGSPGEFEPGLSRSQTFGYRQGL